jgi:gas vesicle protein
MASSSGKPTAVHFSLIFFVMTTIIASVVAYLMYKDYSETDIRLTKATTDLRKINDVARDRDDDIQAIKKRLGIAFDEVGDEEIPNTVLYQVVKDIRDQGGYPQTTAAAQLPTVHDTLIELRQKLDQLQRDYNTAIADLKTRNAEYTSLDGVYLGKADVYLQAQRSAEQLRDTVQQTQKERLDAADTLYREIVAELGAERADHQQDNDSRDKQIASLRQETKDLVLMNERFQEKLDNMERVSFEVSDGEIRWVDHVSRLVWVNLGSDDRLTKRTTFSVYKKSHHGIGRGGNDAGGGAEDIKGSIEITRIIGPHLAEARLIDTDIYEPMAPGDPIYTPLWSPGRAELFSIIGFIDVDGDGRSDRKLLTELLAAAGARFDNEVLDDGTRIGDGINVQTKFFVVAELPDPATTADMEEKKLYTTILGHFSDMQKEARQQGVRKVNLGAFLEFIGYKPQRRLYRPGDGTPYKLKSGSHSTATNENIGNRESSGQTAGVYSRSKRLKQPKSTGQTSKVFRGGR